jgi:plastocyanin
MRLAGLLIVLALALPASALAANADVNVGDNFFDPTPARIQPGDSVTWRWSGFVQHNVRADANQTESFRSAIVSGAGRTFAHTFAKPGRFAYFCEVHPTTMRGAVEVGPAPFPDTLLPRVTGVRARTSGSTAKVSFRLTERSRVRVSLSGPSRKTISRVLRRGRRSLTFRRLRGGRYRASLRATDTAGNRGRLVRSSRFRVR